MRKPLTVIVGFVLIMLFLAGGYYLFRNQNKSATQTNSKITVTPEPTETSTPTPNESNQTGTIEGSLSFPSEYIPEDMEVCAETLEGEVVKCTSEHIQDPKYTYREGYKLEVPPGDYYVYAQTEDREDYKAYYNEFVECGLSVECESHEKIVVEVKAGETISGVDPQDWYNISTPTPTP